MIDDTKKLTPEQAAKRLGLKPSFLGKLRCVGGGPPFFKLGRKVMYSVGDVDAWLATKRVTETPKTSRKKRPAARPVGAPASDHALA